MRLGILLLSLAISGLSIPSAWACSCALIEDLRVTAGRSDIAFAGTVVDVFDSKAGELSRSSQDPIRFTFEVQAIWRGELGRLCEVWSVYGESSCGSKFTPQERYVVFASEREGQWRTGICSFNRALEIAEPTLVALGEPASKVSGFDLPDVSLTSLRTRLRASHDPAIHRVLEAIRVMGNDAKPAVADLVRLASHPDPAVSTRAASVALDLEPGNPDLRDIIRSGARGGSSDLRVSFLTLLWMRGLAVDFDLPDAVQALRDRNENVREAARHRVVARDGDDRRLFGLMEEATRDPSAEIRREALDHCLRNMRDHELPSSRWETLVVRAAEADEEEWALHALAALAKPPEDIREGFVESVARTLLSNSSEQVRIRAQFFLDLLHERH